MDTISSTDLLATDSRSTTVERLSNTRTYRPARGSGVRYSTDEKKIAVKLALETLSEISYMELDHVDRDFYSDSYTQVTRCILEDGSVGYFKCLMDNSFEDSEFISSYGTSTLNAAVNEVNAYRMAQVMGRGFEDLVPETVFREIKGRIGTIQREVLRNEDHHYSMVRDSRLMRADYRKAAIFDFIIGNMDRHSDNFIFSPIPGQGLRIRLIDHSFSFPQGYGKGSVNDCYFSDNYFVGNFQVPEEDFFLRPEERTAIRRARRALESWISYGTIAPSRGKFAIRRVDALLTANELQSLTSFWYGAED